MTYEYRCNENHITTVYGMSVKTHEETTSVPCDKCDSQAFPIMSLPVAHHLYGNPNGYSKPSALKRHSYKLADKSGNQQ